MIGTRRVKRIRHFQTREFFLAFFITDHNGKIHAQVGNMREGMTGIQCQRGQDRIDHFFKVIIGFFGLGFREFVIIKQMDACLVQLRQDLFIETVQRTPI